MELRYLKAFIATARLGSFSRAAEALNIAQSAVSRQIKLLEESTNQELLIRSSKQIVLTEKGRRLLELAELFLQQSQQILQDRQLSLIRIGTVHGVLENWLRNIIVEFCRQEPHQLDILICSAKELETGLLLGKFDLVISPLPIRSDLVSCTQIFEEKRWIVSRDQIDLQQLESYRWIVYNEEDLLYRVSEKKPATFIQVNSITTMLNLVQAGCGIAVLPGHVLANNHILHKYPLPRNPITPIYLANLGYQNLPKPMAVLIEMIKSTPPPQV